jgi:hypothetical protein
MAAEKPTGKAKHPHDSRRPESAAVKLGVEIFREEGDIEPLRHSLSPRQRAFCEEYVVDFIGKAAAIRAGYAIDYADRQASLLKKNAGVAAYIDYLSTSKEAKVVSLDPDYVIQRITAIINKEGTRDGDKLRGLELLARHLGMLRDKTEISGPDGGAIEVEQRRVEEEAEDFTHLIKNIAKKKEVSLV